MWRVRALARLHLVAGCARALARHRQRRAHSAGWRRSASRRSPPSLLAVLARARPERRHAPRDAPRRGAAALVLAALASSSGTTAGPAQRGWARRAGTPVDAAREPPGRRCGPDGRGRAPAVALPNAPFSASLNGKMQRVAPTRDGLVTVVIRGRLHGGAGGSVRIDLRGQPARRRGCDDRERRLVRAGRNAHRLHSAASPRSSGQQVHDGRQDAAPEQRLQLAVRAEHRHQALGRQRRPSTAQPA